MAKPQIPVTLAPDLLDRLCTRFHPWDLIKDWGLTIESASPGTATMCLLPTKAVINGSRGTINGGVLATMADMVGALALSTAFDGAMPFATSDLHIRYLEPAKGEVWGEGKVIRFSGRGAIVECRLTCGDHLVALATANFAIKHGSAVDVRMNVPFPVLRDHGADGPLQRLRYALALLAAVILAGALGYHLLSRLDVLDSFYMAITTLFTVGFRELGEVNARTKIFTIFYLIIGLGVATYAISNLTALLLEGDLRGYLMERRMQKRLDDLRDHVIVCGFGKMGFQAAWELKKAGVPFVIIEQDDSKGRSPRFAGELILYGNAMDDLMLERAGIRYARGLITALTTDADNVLVTLTVKQLRPDMPVVARSAKLGTERQLKAAGADHIVSPYEIGGRRMAGLLLKPEMMNFFDIVLQQEQFELGLERITISVGSPLVGQTLREARLRHATGSLLVGLVHPGAGLRFNPSGDERFQAGDELLIMGPADALANLTRLAREGGTRQ